MFQAPTAGEMARAQPTSVTATTVSAARIVPYQPSISLPVRPVEHSPRQTRLVEGLAMQLVRMFVICMARV